MGQVDRSIDHLGPVRVERVNAMGTKVAGASAGTTLTGQTPPSHKVAEVATPQQHLVAVYFVAPTRDAAWDAAIAGKMTKVLLASVDAVRREFGDDVAMRYMLDIVSADARRKAYQQTDEYAAKVAERKAKRAA